MFPSDSKTHVVASALENAVLPDDRGRGEASGSRGQRITGVARRPVVVVPIPSGRRAGHVPSHDEVRGCGLATRFCRLQDALSACQQVQRVRTWTHLNLFEANGTKVFIYDHLCRASLPREHKDAAVTSMKSAEVWSGLAEWIRVPAAVATLYAEEMNNKHSRKGKSRLTTATFQRYQWYLNNAVMRHAELRGVFRQAFYVSMPTFRPKLDLFQFSKQVSFDGARRIPMLRQMNPGGSR